MEITGKITRVFEVVTGNGKKGMWSKQSFVIEQPGQYPKLVCVDLWGEDLIAKYDLVVGITVTAHINIESREYYGRWYTDVRCYKLTWDEQQKRTWQPGGEPGKGKAGAADTSDEPEDTSLRSHYEGQGNLGSGPEDNSLPF